MKYFYEIILVGALLALILTPTWPLASALIATAALFAHDRWERGRYFALTQKRVDDERYEEVSKRLIELEDLINEQSFTNKDCLTQNEALSQRIDELEKAREEVMKNAEETKRTLSQLNLGVAFRAQPKQR